jgi:uncharacterized protein YjbI with pentapeptide repeats
MPQNPLDLYRKSQEKSPKQQQSTTPPTIDTSSTGLDPKSLLPVLMLLGAIRASDSHPAERSSGSAKKILDDPRNLVIVKKEEDDKIPFATDPKEIPISSKRLLIEGALRLSPSIAEKITSFLPTNTSTQSLSTDSANKRATELNAEQIEKAFNEITQSQEFPKIITEAREFFATKKPEENQDLLKILDSLEYESIQSSTASYPTPQISDLSLTKIREAERKIKKSALKTRESSIFTPINLSYFEEYINTERANNSLGVISLKGTEFENNKFLGEDFCIGILADLSDSPEIKKKYGSLQDSSLFGKRNIVKVIRDVDFSRVDFRSSNINIDNIRFENCNFEGAIMPSSQNAEFINSNLRGTDWSGTEQNLLKIGTGNVEYLVNTQILYLREWFSYSESDQINSELNRKMQPFFTENQLIEASGSSFKGCTLISPNFYKANFQDADFDQSRITLKPGEPLIIKNCDNLDLKSTSYESSEILEKDSAIKIFSGLEEIDFNKLKEQCAEIYGQEKADRLFTDFSTDGFIPKELLEKLRDNQKIVVKIHINPDSIDKYLDYYIEQGYSYGLDSSKRTLDQKTKENLSKNVIGYLSKLYGEYNFEFVDQNSPEAIDFNINIGVLSPNSNREGASFSTIGIGNSTLMIGGDPLNHEFVANYQTLSHELLHGLSAGFTQFGSHTHLLEPAKEVGMSSHFCGALTYERNIDLVIGDKCYKIQYDEYFSSKGEDYVSPCDYDKNTKFLEFLGREKVEVWSSDLENSIQDPSINKIFFQQFPERENKIVIDASLKNLYDISVVKARDVVKYCRLPSINLCIDNHNIKKDEMVVIFKNKEDDEVEPTIIYLSGGQKEIAIGEEILYSDRKEIFGQSSSVEISQPLTSEFLQGSTPQPITKQTSPEETPRQTSPEETPRQTSPEETPRQTSPEETPRQTSPEETPIKPNSTPRETPGQTQGETNPLETSPQLIKPTPLTTSADLVNIQEIEGNAGKTQPEKPQPVSTPISEQESDKKVSSLFYLLLLIPASATAIGVSILKSRMRVVADNNPNQSVSGQIVTLTPRTDAISIIVQPLTSQEMARESL